MVPTLVMYKLFPAGLDSTFLLDLEMLRLIKTFVHYRSEVEEEEY